MGSNWSKLKKYVEKGDETKALEIYHKSADIRRKLNANAVVNELTLDTYMHLSAMHGMFEFLKLLLNENKGNPNKLNRNNQTVLHKCCQGSKDLVQYECLKLLLQWHSPVTTDQQQQQNRNDLSRNDSNSSNSRVNSFIPSNTEINVNAKDMHENTPLHYAAMKNLPTCVQTLFAYGAYLFIENAEHSTPCDLAERHGQRDIALFLESKMIFSKEVDEIENENDSEQQVVVIESKPNYGLQIKDLQAEKEKLLIETADILRCSLFTAQIMLKKHAWSKEKLLNSWIEDPVKCLEKCGISSAAIDLTNSKDEFKNVLISTDNIINSNNITTSNNDKINNNNNKSNKAEHLKIFQFDSEKIIARKMSGRYLVKKKESSLSLKTNLNEMNTNIQNGLKKHSVSQIIEVDSYPSDNVVSLDKDSSSDAFVNGSSQIVEENNNFIYCEICFFSFDIKTDLFVEILCGHRFCRACWEQYLSMKIEEGNVCDIVCPQVNCFAIIPHSVIESLVSKEMVEKYLHFDIKAFVDSNPTIKWCPHPNCGMAVRNPNLLKENANPFNSTVGNQSIEIDAQSDQNFAKDSSSTVDCGNGHLFCWDCLQEGHEPATCKNWKDWYQKIIEIKPEELNDTAENEALSANYLWLVTNSKKCPNLNCNAPIQKNEGCNHVKCYKCKYDFCWICLESWKKHSSVTGGYFQCNRYEASAKIIQKQTDTIARAEDTHLKAVELNKFIHYYTRFKNHEHSFKIEQPLLAMAKTKFEILIAQNSVLGTNENDIKYLNEEKSNSIDPVKNIDNNNNKELTLVDSKELENFDSIQQVVDLSKDNSSLCKIESLNENQGSNNNYSISQESHLFIEEAIKELLKARKILRCSYVYGYYLDTFGHRKFIFEFIQTEFEECTENLSQIIARPHLKTPKYKIVKLTNVLRKKRIEFLDTITRGLNSFNDTPPALKKYSRQRWKYLLKDNIQNDDEFKNTIALSLKELNPKNPWIIDKKGRHTNLLALLNDWPELEAELDSILVPSKEKKVLCAKWDCGNVRAVNSLSGSLCNYCSIKCMRSDRNAYLEDKRIPNQPELVSKISESNKIDLNSKDPVKQVFSIHASTASTSSKHMNISDLKKVAFRLSRSKASHSSSLGSNNSINNQNHRQFSSIERGRLSSFRSGSTSLQTYGQDLENDLDADLDNALEVSRLQYYLDQTKNENKLESDTQKAIELSLKTDDACSSNNDESATNSISSTSKLNDSSLNNNRQITMIPYDTLFLNSSNENDISVLMKNMEKVLYDKRDQDKIEKVCNFQVKLKK